MMNKYWNTEKLKEISTIETSIEDYKNGFTTSFDGDNKAILMGNTCFRCGEQIEEYRRIGHRLASNLCQKCKAIKFR